MLNYFNKMRQRKGQSTLEYAILIIIIIGALLSIQVYIKRGYQGRMKQASDDIGDQFSPGNTKINVTKTTTGKTRETFESGVTNSTLEIAEETRETGTSNIINVDQEFWGNK